MLILFHILIVILCAVYVLRIWWIINTVSVYGRRYITCMNKMILFIMQDLFDCAVQKQFHETYKQGH